MAGKVRRAGGEGKGQNAKCKLQSANCEVEGTQARILHQVPLLCEDCGVEWLKPTDNTQELHVALGANKVECPECGSGNVIEA